MSAAPLVLRATVGVAERPLALAAAEQVSAAIGTALGHEWPVRLTLATPDEPPSPAAVSIASLIEDVARDEPIEATMARWEQRIARDLAPRILLSTLFRHPGPGGGVTVERLRRFNMAAVQLSRSSGIEIVDIDRVFAWCGARRLGTDYRCLGPRAAAVGGHAIAAAILDGDLGDGLDPAVQERAGSLHGGVQNIAAIIKRRIPEP